MVGIHIGWGLQDLTYGRGGAPGFGMAVSWALEVGMWWYDVRIKLGGWSLFFASLPPCFLSFIHDFLYLSVFLRGKQGSSSISLRSLASTGIHSLREAEEADMRKRLWAPREIFPECWAVEKGWKWWIFQHPGKKTWGSTERFMRASCGSRGSFLLFGILGFVFIVFTLNFRGSSGFVWPQITGAHCTLDHLDQCQRSSKI